MAITKWWRLAIAAGVSECLVYAEAKYCAFEIHGEPKYYVCPKTEYCCNFGCCVSPAFQMYHLWYYWLLVIIMFLVCSGGGWWYRYWLHGRFRTTASTIPNRSNGTRTQSTMRDPTCRAQQARISYNTARNTVLLHRMWKAHRGVTSPAYSAAGPASSNTHYQNTSVVLNDVNCPYYQLYGPPPSYETVIAQSRGKLSTPSSPELLRPGQSSVRTAQAANEANYVGPCFYNVRPGLGLEESHYQPPTATCSPGHRIVEGFDMSEYIRLMQQQQQHAGVVAGPTTIMTSPRHQAPLYESRPAAKDNSDPEATNNQADSPESGGFSASTGRMDCADHSCLGLDRSLPCYSSIGKSTCRVAVHGTTMRRPARCEPASSSSQSESSSELPSTSSLTGSSDMLRSELRRVQGGSLKIPRRRELRQQQQQHHHHHHHHHQQQEHQQEHQQQQQDFTAARINRRLSSTSDYYHQIGPGVINRLVCSEDLRSQLTIPSSNVIAPTAAASTSKCNDVVELNDQSRHEKQQQQQQQHQKLCQLPTALSVIERSSTNNSNVESKRKKLDRSKSLD